jgi:hypothetical protein
MISDYSYAMMTKYREATTDKENGEASVCSTRADRFSFREDNNAQLNTPYSSAPDSGVARLYPVSLSPSSM